MISRRVKRLPFLAIVSYFSLFCFTASAEPRDKSARSAARASATKRNEAAQASAELREPAPEQILVAHGPEPDDVPRDPPPQRSASRWLFDLRYRHGTPRLLATEHRALATPRRTARGFGRFALEGYQGTRLVERVRFDFPLLGLPAKGHVEAALERQLSTRIGVYFPALPQIDRLDLLDRATGQRWRVPLPAPRAE